MGWLVSWLLGFKTAFSAIVLAGVVGIVLVLVQGEGGQGCSKEFTSLGLFPSLVGPPGLVPWLPSIVVQFSEELIS